MEMDQIESFLRRQRERGLKPKSLKAYRSSLCRTRKLMGELGLSCRAEDLTLEHIEDYVRYSQELGYKSVRYDVAILRLFAKFHTGEDPVGDIRLMYAEHEPRRLHLSKEDFGRLYSEASPEFRVAMVMGAGMGLRVSEMVRAKWSDIVGDEMIVTGKGHGSGKTCRLIIPDIVRAELDSWKERISGIPDGTDGRILGYVSNGRLVPFDEKKLSGRGRTLSKRLGIEFTMHSFRRLFATTLYTDAHTDLNSLRLMMRHSSLNTTLIYLRDDKSERRRSSAALGETLGSYL